MTTGSAHLGDSIQDLLDGRLDPDARARAETHLTECPQCRREHDALRWTKSVVARGTAEPGVPADVASAVSRSLDLEAFGSGAVPPRGIGWRRLRPALAAGLLLVLVGLAVLLRPGRQVTDLPASVAHDYANVRSGAMPIELRTADPKALEQLFAANGIPFETRVFDLGMMRYRVVGGRVHVMAGQPSALFVYQGPGLLICQMFRGRLADLPAPEVVRENQGIRFNVYRRDGLTLVFWQEGDVVCVLASEIPAEDVIQLAFAKAMMVARQRLDRPAERDRLRDASRGALERGALDRRGKGARTATSGSTTPA